MRVLIALLFFGTISCAKEDVSQFQTEIEDLQSANGRLSDIHEMGFKFESTDFFDIPLNDSLKLFDLADQGIMFMRFAEDQCLVCIEQVADALQGFTDRGKQKVVILATYESTRNLSLYLKRLGIDSFQFFNIERYPDQHELEGVNEPYMFQLSGNKLVNLWLPHYTLQELNEAYIYRFFKWQE